MLQNIESIGRVCYKSEDKITAQSCSKFVRALIKRGHESVLEHEAIAVKFIVDRGISHEIVRHRLASYSQSSTRYCNYSQDKFGNEITVIKPCFVDDDDDDDMMFYRDGEYTCYGAWRSACEFAEKHYFKLLEMELKPEEARSVLPNSLMTELVMTANLREWRHFFKLRTSKAAHPQMREIAIPLLNEFKEKLPEIFEDIEVEN